MQAWTVFGTLLSDSSADASNSYASLHPSPSERTINIENAMRREAPPKRPGPDRATSGPQPPSSLR